MGTGSLAFFLFAAGGAEFTAASRVHALERRRRRLRTHVARGQDTKPPACRVHATRHCAGGRPD